MLRRALPTLYQRLWAARAWRALRGRNRYRADLPLGQQLALVRRGFFPAAGLMYRLDGPSEADYVTDYERYTRTSGLNGADAFFLDSKFAFFLMVRTQAPHLLPHHLGFYRHGHVIPTAPDSPVRSTQELLNAMADKGTTVVKPVLGGGGASVHIVRYDAGQWEIGGRPSSRKDVEGVLHRLGDVVVMERVQQARYAEDIFPGSANTLRMLTIRPDGGAPILAAVVHRFGTARTTPVDNWTKGGLSCSVDVATGEIGPGAVHPSIGGTGWLDHHPDTGARITGTVIPGWADVLSSVLDLAGRVPPRYVGWDVVVSERVPLLLEGNRYSELGVLQIHRPLMADPRVRDFFRATGVVRR